MALLSYLPIALFVAVIANDWLLARRIRKAVESQRFKAPYLDNFGSAGSPLGIILNLFRLRKIPATNDLSDPDHIAIRLHYRAHLVLLVFLGACIGALLFIRITA
jgi:hypothetical protein